jgi:hypothetical protein
MADRKPAGRVPPGAAVPSAAEHPTGLDGSARRVLRIVLLLFALALAGLAAVAWFAGEGSDVELEYEGID